MKKGIMILLLTALGLGVLLRYLRREAGKGKGVSIRKEQEQWIEWIPP